MVRVLPLIDAGPESTLNVTVSPDVLVAEREIGAAPKLTGDAGATNVMV
jgi:hypothetical protein